MPYHTVLDTARDGRRKSRHHSFSLPLSGCCASEQQYYFHCDHLDSFGISTNSQVRLQMNGSSFYTWDGQRRLCWKSRT